MRRRDFVKSLVAAGSLFAAAPRQIEALQVALLPPLKPEPADAQVKRVLVIFKCHFDAGFIDTQASVVAKYFNQYFPQAIQTAATMRQAGSDRYIWTTGSWLLYEYLEKAPQPAKEKMRQAIDGGDIAWHALPFSWQTELMDRSLIVGGLGLSRSLDARFNRTTIGAKMTDVPGHTRGIISPLAEHGVSLLDIGVNAASTPPDVAPIFLWRNAAGQSIAMMYHLHDYGGVIRVPGSDLAIDVEVRNDNSGPHTIEEIGAIYQKLRQRFPNALVTAANLTDIAHAVKPHHGNLPVVTQEIGDTWIYGCPSDPLKVARYREFARLRREWISQGKFGVADPVDMALLPSLLLEAEHTWGTDTKTWMDFDHYTPHDLAEMLDTPKYRVVQSSWEEKRKDLFDAIDTLPPALRAEAGARVAALNATRPASQGLQPHSANAPIDAAHFTLALDSQTGAITRLLDKKSGREWASAQNPLALFCYQTLSKADYDRFFAAYLLSDADWAPKDFGKPNIDRFGAEHRNWFPALNSLLAGGDANQSRVLAELKIKDTASQSSSDAALARVAWPQTMYLEILLPDADPVIELNFHWFGKPNNRMPEALWLTFQPLAPNRRGWALEKAGETVDPLDVVPGGNRHMHALSGGLRYRDAKGSMMIESVDAPVVALGEREAVYFSKDQPDLTKGLHFSLFNNGWGTNYVQWFGEDMRFRFRIKTA